VQRLQHAGQSQPITPECVRIVVYSLEIWTKKLVRDGDLHRRGGMPVVVGTEGVKTRACPRIYVIVRAALVKHTLPNFLCQGGIPLVCSDVLLCS